MHYQPFRGFGQQLASVARCRTGTGIAAEHTRDLLLALGGDDRPAQGSPRFVVDILPAHAQRLRAAAWRDGHIEATAEFPRRGLFDVHTKFKAQARYADGVELVQETGNPAGVRFVGERGSIFVQRGKIEAEPAELLQEPLGDSDVRLYVSDNHYRNWLDCMRSGAEPICPVEVGHRSNTVCVITHIAMKLGRKLRWDPKAETFVDDAAANAMLDYEHRKPWTL